MAKNADFIEELSYLDTLANLRELRTKAFPAKEAAEVAWYWPASKRNILQRELRQDHLLSWLHRYVHTLGGELHVVVTLGDELVGRLQLPPLPFPARHRPPKKRKPARSRK